MKSHGCLGPFLKEFGRDNGVRSKGVSRRLPRCRRGGCRAKGHGSYGGSRRADRVAERPRGRRELCRERWSACHWFCGSPSMHVHAYVPAAVDVVQVLRARRDTRHADSVFCLVRKGSVSSTCGAARWCWRHTVCSGGAERGEGTAGPFRLNVVHKISGFVGLSRGLWQSRRPSPLCGVKAVWVINSYQVACDALRRAGGRGINEKRAVNN